MFLQGEIVKSKQRTEKHELFLMVLFDPDPSSIQFKGVILKDFTGHDKSGYITNTWNISKFKLSSWNELKELL